MVPPKEPFEVHERLIDDGFVVLCGAADHLPGWRSRPFPTTELAESERQKHAQEHPGHNPFVSTVEEAIEIQRDWAMQDRAERGPPPAID
jgi:hypothetical protein